MERKTILPTLGFFFVIGAVTGLPFYSRLAPALGRTYGVPSIIGYFIFTVATTVIPIGLGMIGQNATLAFIRRTPVRGKFSAIVAALLLGVVLAVSALCLTRLPLGLRLIAMPLVAGLGFGTAITAYSLLRILQQARRNR